MIAADEKGGSGQGADEHIYLIELRFEMFVKVAFGAFVGELLGALCRVFPVGGKGNGGGFRATEVFGDDATGDAMLAIIVGFGFTWFPRHD